MIRAWKAFKLTEDGKLCALATQYVFDGPVNRGARPFVESYYNEIASDPAGVVERRGLDWLRANHVPPEEVPHNMGPNKGMLFWAVTFCPPKPQPRYGFFSFTTRVQAVECCGEYSADAIAEVDLFGCVVEHETGYRSEGFTFARVYVREDRLETLKAPLETLYDCEVAAWPTSERNDVSTRWKSTHLTFGASVNTTEDESSVAPRKRREKIASWCRQVGRDLQWALEDVPTWAVHTVWAAGMFVGLVLGLFIAV